MAGRSRTATSVGGSSVTCGGTRLAWGSPTLARQSTSSWAHGSGTGTTMPRTVVCGATARLRGTKVSSFTRAPLRAGSRPARRPRRPCRRRPRGHGRRPAASTRSSSAGSPSSSWVRSRTGVDEVGDHLGQLLLQVAVAAAGEVLLEVGDGAAGQRAVDGEQVGDARLALGVGDDLAAGVGDRRADLLRRHRGVVEQVDAAGRRQALAHLLVRRLQVEDLRRALRDVRGGHA